MIIPSIEMRLNDISRIGINRREPRRERGKERLVKMESRKLKKINNTIKISAKP
jgi:hypothetical protein